MEVEALTWEVGGQRGCVTLIDVPRLRIYDDNDIYLFFCYNILNNLEMTLMSCQMFFF